MIYNNLSKALPEGPSLALPEGREQSTFLALSEGREQSTFLALPEGRGPQYPQSIIMFGMYGIAILSPRGELERGFTTKKSP